MARRHAGVGILLAAVVASAQLTGCSGVDQASSDDTTGKTAPREAPATTPTEPRSSPPSDPGTTSPATEDEARVERPRPAREPRRSQLSIPAIGLDWVPVVRYVGSPDDAKGTRIQDRGPTASPRGSGGGVGPGEVGNFIVTGHRTSHSAPFRDLPALDIGDRVRVRSGQTVFVYQVTATRWTSFRSERSRAQQTAAVPGRPRAQPVRSMITLSTCATPEDHANGNYWSDRFGNPEHRIDKVGVLVTQFRARPRAYR